MKVSNSRKMYGTKKDTIQTAKLFRPEQIINKGARKKQLKKIGE